MSGAGALGGNRSTPTRIANMTPPTRSVKEMWVEVADGREYVMDEVNSFVSNG
jgi:hypothetical protein